MRPTPHCLALLAVLMTLGVHAQGDPPALPYVAAPDHFHLPEGVNFGPVASVAINSAGNMYIGGLGKASGQFGEAHWVALDAGRNIYIGDVFNWRVQKFSPGS